MQDIFKSFPQFTFIFVNSFKKLLKMLIYQYLMQFTKYKDFLKIASFLNNICSFLQEVFHR